jgi:hypothetical protein
MTAFTQDLVGAGPRLRGLVHDLRQPISAMAAVGDVLARRDDIPDEAQKWIRLMVDQGQVMFGLCRELESAVEEIA